MFNLSDFRIFQEPTVDGRLAAIRSVLDPKFVAAGNTLQTLAQTHAGVTLHVHIAKHARRFKNPPVNTWLALSASARGYKMLPHIELGFWDDRLFLWCGVLQAAKPFSGQWPGFASLPAGFALAGDHTNKAFAPATAKALDQQNQRFAQVAKAEWLLTRVYLQTDPLWQEPAALWADIQTHYLALLPSYQTLCK